MVKVRGRKSGKTYDAIQVNYENFFELVEMPGVSVTLKSSPEDDGYTVHGDIFGRYFFNGWWIVGDRVYGDALFRKFYEVIENENE